MNSKVFGPAISLFLLALTIASIPNSVAAYAPRSGDFFNYSDTTTVNNGGGTYAGYTDQSQTTGKERMQSIGGSNVSVTYSYSFQFSNSLGNSSSKSATVNYTWSSSSFTYLRGTDNQAINSSPLYVWFAMNPSLPVGSTFFALDAQFTVLSKNYSLQVPTQNNQYFQTIQAKGTGQYQRNDVYGQFTASYTWYEYFDPTTGYIIGYNYVEQDNGYYQGQASFTYTDNLYVTSTSFSLAPANPPPVNPFDTLVALAPYLVLLGVAVVFAFGIAVYATRRRRRMDTIPEHPPAPVTFTGPPPSTPFESRIDLGSKPPPQVVIRDVAKVNCKYCGTLIPTTADTCPYCGGPRR